MTREEAETLVEVRARDPSRIERSRPGPPLSLCLSLLFLLQSSREKKDPFVPALSRPVSPLRVLADCALELALDRAHAMKGSNKASEHANGSRRGRRIG